MGKKSGRNRILGVMIEGRFKKNSRNFDWENQKHENKKRSEIINC